MIINTMYRMAFDRNKAEEKLSDEEKAAKALSELPESIEEGLI